MDKKNLHGILGRKQPMCTSNPLVKHQGRSAPDSHVGAELGHEHAPVHRHGLHAVVGRRTLPNKKGIGSNY